MNQPADRVHHIGRFDALLDLPAPLLTALAASFENGPLSETLTLAGVRGLVGDVAPGLVDVLRGLATDGFQPRQTATLLRGLAAAAAATPKPSELFDVVLSGPAVPGVPTSDTAAVMHTLLTHAEREVLLVGYAVYNGKKLFEPLADRMRHWPDLSVTMCLDIRRPQGDTRADAEIVTAFAREFRERHWPWPQVPKLYYDPRSLETGPQRASLHAKCAIVDGSRALVTSANFTDAAQWKNIEAGVEIRHVPSVRRLAEYFRGLMRLDQFREVRL
jgi:phosphatidylserine/phosphatidylglycerophosphate/cardiolipin synthase-like enzyme